MNPIDYLEKLNVDLLEIDLEFFSEAEYIRFEAIRKKTAMCFETLFGADSAQVSRIYNIVTGERFLRATPEKRQDYFFRAIQDLSSEIETAIDSQKLAPAKPKEQEKSHQQEMGFTSILHPLIAESSLVHFANGHFRDAVLNGVIAIFDLIRRRTGLQQDGSALIGQAFSVEAGKLIFSELGSDSGLNDQKGFLKILDGTYIGIRNPKAHTLIHDLDQTKAAQYLVFLSLLARRVADAKLRPQEQ